MDIQKKRQALIRSGILADTRAVVERDLTFTEGRLTDVVPAPDS
jgi:hypothetical protein